MKPTRGSLEATVLTGLLALAVVASLEARADFTWNGGSVANDFWSTAENWVGATAPATPGDGTGAVVIAAGGPSVVNAAHSVSSVSLGGNQIVRVGSGGALTLATWGTTGGARLEILDGGQMTVNGLFTHNGWERRLALNATGDGTGKLTVNGDFIVGYQNFAFITAAGASDSTHVLQVSGIGYLYNRFDMTSGRATFGSWGDLLHLNLSGGRMEFGGRLATRGGGTVAVSGGTLSAVGEVRIASGDYGSGPASFTLSNTGTVALTGTGTPQINVGFSSNSNNSNNGPGYLRIQDNAFLNAPNHEIRIGVGSYSDGHYEQSGGSVLAKNLWVGYASTVYPGHDAGKRGYGNFAMSGGTLSLTNFNVRGGVNASVAMTGGTVAITSGLFGIRSVDETANIDLAGAHLLFQNNGSLLEAAGFDYGEVVAGYFGNYSLGTLELADGALLTLQDLFNNVSADGGAPEAVYVRALVLGAGSTLDLNGLNLYAGVITDAGATFPDGTPFWVPIPEPASGLLLVAGLALGLLPRRRR